MRADCGEPPVAVIAENDVFVRANGAVVPR